MPNGISCIFVLKVGSVDKFMYTQHHVHSSLLLPHVSDFSSSLVSETLPHFSLLNSEGSMLLLTDL